MDFSVVLVTDWDPVFGHIKEVTTSEAVMRAFSCRMPATRDSTNPVGWVFAPFAFEAFVFPVLSRSFGRDGPDSVFGSFITGFGHLHSAHALAFSRFSRKGVRWVILSVKFNVLPEF